MSEINGNGGSPMILVERLKNWNRRRIVRLLDESTDAFDARMTGYCLVVSSFALIAAVTAGAFS
tara:strand:+ start:10039 stop:10230 length:192 start_codon:yes stop_codon:yes gene_type:complete